MTASSSNPNGSGQSGTFASGNLPSFDDIPAVAGMPHGCAWNVWGQGDELGTLNLLTPDVVARSASECIRTGERVQIDWGLDSVDVPANQRKHFHHQVIDLHSKLGVYATDDEVHLNTQTSSQWDGFNHFAHQATHMYYGGVKHDDLHSGKVDKAERNSMHKWCLNGGIAGRGVLVDWVHWWESTQSDPIPAGNQSYAIPLEQIKQVLAWQRTQLRTGDILLLRTGVVRWFEQASEQEKVKAMIENDNFPGIEATEEVKRWLWDSHFAAVASDNMSFEFGPHGDLWLHEWILPMFGCPIGELFDLERLSTACQKHDRWTFFLTSAPIRVQGGIASSPNAICIF
ncbi:hypothetical protein PHBOTO_002753 [Pseudozyma hubeiensis]|nr:hypothetical protein PHBOTO_002753 [Pseudozyma hubeiensis]